MLNVGTCQPSTSTAVASLLTRADVQGTWSKPNNGNKGPCFEPALKPHRQVQVQKPQRSLAASCSVGSGLPSLRPGTAQPWAKGKTKFVSAKAVQCKSCHWDNFTSCSWPSPQHAASETGRSSAPLSKGSNRSQSIWLAAGGSAARGSSRQGNSCRASPSIAGVFGAAGPRGREGRAGLGPLPRGWGAWPPSTLPASQAGSEPRCRDVSSFIPSPQRDQFLINAKPAQTAPGEEWEVPALAVAELLCAWRPAETRGQRSRLLR